jgi:hypothetical protein
MSLALGFETFGNATILCFDGGRPILATDPWLFGTCYFGSWGLERPLSEEQMRNVCAADYIWISHGHPDHLHIDSLKRLPAGKTVLLPDHYHPEIRDFLRLEGFAVEVMPYRKWRKLSANVSALCIDNENQDAILVLKVGDALLINLNDSPLCGEFRFLRKLVRQHPNEKTYLTALCAAGTADMLNFVDEHGSSLAGSSDQRKRGVVWEIARIAAALGVRHYCFSSAQHVYVRPDTMWINDFTLSWDEILRHWSRPQVQTVPPFVAVDALTGRIEAQPAPAAAAEPAQAETDDWEARLSEEEWGQVEAFFRRFELLRKHVDFVVFTVGGETRRIAISGRKIAPEKERGVFFHAPKLPLLETVKYGYFDDLLISNIMKARLQNMELYPHFTPVVAKLGGNAKVFTRREARAFYTRYLLRNPAGFLSWRLEQAVAFSIVPAIRRLADAAGLKEPLRQAYRALRGDPIRRQKV